MGLVQDEMNFVFPDHELRKGITPKTKDRYLRTLVRNTFTFHLNEIFATIQNEYTDWTNVESLSDFSDGRGFTLARLIRLFGFVGQLRAKGCIIADQYAMARRFGFDEVEISAEMAARQPEEQWLFRSKIWQDHYYQARLWAQ